MKIWKFYCCIFKIVWFSNEVSENIISALCSCHFNLNDINIFIRHKMTCNLDKECIFIYILYCTVVNQIENRKLNSFGTSIYRSVLNANECTIFILYECECDWGCVCVCVICTFKIWSFDDSYFWMDGIIIYKSNKN